MTAAAIPTAQYSLASPPPGSSFEYGEVKTDRGTRSLGQVPLLTWGEDAESVNHMIAFYGPEGIANMANGTSFRVSFQGIARRMKEKGKSDEEIAKEMIDFRPGKREGGQSTPASRVANQAKRVAASANADAIGRLLKLVEDKSVPQALLDQLGITAEEFYTALPQPAAAENGEGEGEGQDQ